MNTSESDTQHEFHQTQQELLRTIAASLKGIQFSLDRLTGAVEGVSESIETAHEPEGDLGTHLVAALKDIASAMHKRAAQERNFQPQQPPRQQHQNPQQQRREDRPPLRLTPREEQRPPQNQPENSRDDASDQDSHAGGDSFAQDEPLQTDRDLQGEATDSTQANVLQQPPKGGEGGGRLRKPRPNRRRGKNIPREGKPLGVQNPEPSAAPSYPEAPYPESHQPPLD